MDGRRVGYSVVAPGAPSEWDYGGWLGFYRREFFLKAHDRDSDPTGVYETGCPIEGVDPRTVRPGVPGEQNGRAWGVPPKLPRRCGVAGRSKHCRRPSSGL